MKEMGKNMFNWVISLDLRSISLENKLFKYYLLELYAVFYQFLGQNIILFNLHYFSRN